MNRLASAIATDPARILIVEDEPNVRLMFRTALESNAYTLSAAEDGETALRWLKEAPADLVLLDLRMPGMDGMDVLRRLRAAGNGVPVVIVTAHGSIPDAVQAMKLGAVDFVTKPITPEALRSVVANVLARHRPEPRPSPSRPPSPDLASDTVDEAKRELNHREFDKADNLLKKALEINPRSAEAHYLAGVLHELRDEHPAAYQSYHAALLADPNYEPAKLHLMKYFHDKLM